MHRRIACVIALSTLAVSAQERSPLRLTMKHAVDLAISPEGSARIQIAGEAIRQAEARVAQARSALLPNLEGQVVEQDLTRNLAALGIRVRLPIPGFQFPTFVGPFTVFDARASLTQSILDVGAIRRVQAARVAVKAAGSENASAQDQVAAQVAKAYIAALRTEADLEALQANVKLAEAVLEQTQHQRDAGTGTGIEVTRARVQLSNERQRLLVAGNDRQRTRLQLLRAIGLRLDTPLDLTDKLSYIAVDAVTLEQARKQALETRPDVKAQQERESSAQITTSAIRLEGAPSITAFGDYGAIGPRPHNSRPTRTVGVSLRVPVFDGGRRGGRRAEAASQFRQEHIRTTELKEQVELEVRLALDALRSAEDQVKVSEEGLSLADDELAQARRRYEAGVTNGLEVTDAQTRLARARDNRIAALFNYNQARLDLGQAMGTIRGMIQ
jgi:outer membrane protein